MAASVEGGKTRGRGRPKNNDVSIKRTEIHCFITPEFQDCLSTLTSFFDVNDKELAQLTQQYSDLQAEYTLLVSKYENFPVLRARTKKHNDEMTRRIRHLTDINDQLQAQIENHTDLLSSCETESRKLEHGEGGVRQVSDANNKLTQEIEKLTNNNTELLLTLSQSSSALKTSMDNLKTVQQARDALFEEHGCLVCHDVLTDNRTHTTQCNKLCCLSCMQNCMNEHCYFCNLPALKAVKPQHKTTFYI